MVNGLLLMIGLDATTQGYIFHQIYPGLSPGFVEIWHICGAISDMAPLVLDAVVNLVSCMNFHLVLDAVVNFVCCMNTAT